jgi:hypothetical protein
MLTEKGEGMQTKKRGRLKKGPTETPKKRLQVLQKKAREL